MVAKVPVSMFTRFRNAEIALGSGVCRNRRRFVVRLHGVSRQVGAPPRQSHSRKAQDRIRPEYEHTGKLQKLEYDRNNDGKVDT